MADFTNPETGVTTYGIAADRARGAYERKQAEDEQAATVRAVAKLGVWMAAQMATTRRSGPDVLREALEDDEDALRVLRMAGQNADQIARSWAAEPPVQVAQQSSIFTDDPRYDDRFVTAQLKGADVRAALREIATDTKVTARCSQKAEIALGLLASGKARGVLHALELADLPRDLLRRQLESASNSALNGLAFAARDERGVPVQTSTVRQDVAELGSEVV